MWSWKTDLDISRQAGFTLIEAMLALVLLTVGVLTVVQGYSLCLKGQRDAEAHSLATILAQKKLEEIRTGPAPLESSVSGNFMETEVDQEFAGYGLAGQDFTWSVEYTPEDLSGLVKIELTVLWPGREKPQSETFIILHYWPPTQEDSAESSGGEAA